MKLFINSWSILKTDFGIFLLLRICLIVFMILDPTKAQRKFPENSESSAIDMKMGLAENISGVSDSEHLLKPQGCKECTYPIRMETFLKSLKELKFEEGHNRKKKSLNTKKKRIPPQEMRDKIKELMGNISKTLTDVDWYFSYEQSEGQGNNIIHLPKNKPSPRLVIERMRKVDDENSDVFVDSFVQQMYELDPAILEKISNRINREFSSVKRKIRLAPTEKSVNRKANINAIMMNEEEPYVYSDDDVFYEDILTEIPEEVSNIQNYISIINETSVDRGKKSFIEELDYTDTSPTTTVTTPMESFYDYGDYYRELSDTDRLYDMANYEIIQDILQSTTGPDEYDNDFRQVQIKNRYRKGKNSKNRKKKKIKKRLKGGLKTYDKLQNHEGYNLYYYY